MSCDDLTTRVQRIALRQQTATAEHARRNRERFPEFAAFVDDFKSVFGDVRVLYLHDESSGYTAGRPVPGSFAAERMKRA